MLCKAWQTLQHHAAQLLAMLSDHSLWSLLWLLLLLSLITRRLPTSQNLQRGSLAAAALMFLTYASVMMAIDGAYDPQLLGEIVVRGLVGAGIVLCASRIAVTFTSAIIEGPAKWLRRFLAGFRQIIQSVVKVLLWPVRSALRRQGPKAREAARQAELERQAELLQAEQQQHEKQQRQQLLKQLREQLQYDMRLVYSTLDCVAKEVIGPKQFEKLLQDALAATSAETIRLRIAALREGLMSLESAETERDRSWKSVADVIADYDLRREQLAQLDGARRETLEALLLIEEEQAITKFLETHV